MKLNSSSDGDLPVISTRGDPKPAGKNYAELSHTATETQRAINLAANKTPRWGLAYVTHDMLTHSVHENIYGDTLARDTSLTSSFY